MAKGGAQVNLAAPSRAEPFDLVWPEASPRPAMTGPDQDEASISDEIEMLRRRLHDRLLDRFGIRADDERFAEALEDLDDAAAVVPEETLERELRAALASSRGWALVHLGRFEDGRREAERAVSIGSGSPGGTVQLLINHALALAKSGDLEAALPLYDRCEALDPAEPAVYYDRACVLCQLGRLPEALGNLERSIALDEKRRSKAAESADFDNLRTDTAFRDAFHALVQAPGLAGGDR